MLFSKRRQRLAILLFSICLCGVLLLNSSWAVTQPAPTQNADVSAIKPLSVTDNVRKTILENGLTVLTKEVPTAPVVSVQVWYQIGSRDEAPGVNGIAHQLEHMLFKGTTERPIQFGRLFSALGSDSNAFTSYDQTAYFGTVERSKLQTLLTLEADRMQNALIDPQELENEKRVVISELQGYENEPGYRLSRAVMQAVFPNSPYGLPVGGTKADVQKFTVEQVREYYRNYYSPDNATLVVVGDFDTNTALAAIKETFGKVANRKVATPSRTQQLRAILIQSQKPTSSQDRQNNQPQTPESPIVLQEPGAAALLQTVYPLPDVNHPDVPTLDVMDYIISEGRNSRLYQALIETGLASDAMGSVASMKSSGWYRLAATAVPGQALPKIDSVIQQAIAQLQTKGVTQEEVNRAKALVRATIILSNRDITSQAMQLGFDQSTAGNYRYSDRYLAAIEQVTAADVQRVAKTYLQPQKRTVGFFEPTTLQEGSAGTEEAVQTHESLAAGPPADPAEVAKYLPQIESATPTVRQLPEQFKLTNGLEVLLLADKSTPTVTLSGYIKAGSEYDANATAGLATLTADNLMNGTKTKNAQILAAALENQGASLEFAAFREGVDVTGYSLATDLPVLVQTFADVMQNANFPANELELARQRALTNLKLELDSPAQVARRQFQQTIYPPNHPYHSFPTAESLQQISREDVMRFYQQHYRPDRVILTFVGDFEPQQVRSLLEQQLKGWRFQGEAPTVNYPHVSPPKSVVQQNPVLPGKTQAVTFMGYKGIERRDPRYYSALVLNQILGGDTLSSRLGTEIRDRLGLTYGIYSYFQAGRHAGPFLIQMQTSPEDATRAIASTIQLLQQVHTQGVNQDELDTAKRSLTSGYTVSLANPDHIANQILINAVNELSAEELRAFSQKLQAVTLNQVNQAAKELLQPNNIVVVTAGPGISTTNR
ncbi:insulinase family protein [Gloeocapsopsis crepidinum LEGE 06123]|uniref:Insulinase family protein n=1 Tax=Gloeocapsopsis crepidinum LEGE 06123 TaxID=588587 RepID=A0ABR9US55_9CHRO|nr:pitrilysin family protein [Gloeocapsopsis crepidinum]MBE9190888.1 insulinase family protein [Gloeocapsopsis crepidinum LEGE 06123]